MYIKYEILTSWSYVVLVRHKLFGKLTPTDTATTVSEWLGTTERRGFELLERYSAVCYGSDPYAVIGRLSGTLARARSVEIVIWFGGCQDSLVADCYIFVRRQPQQSVATAAARQSETASPIGILGHGPL